MPCHTTGFTARLLAFARAKVPQHADPLSNPAAAAWSWRIDPGTVFRCPSPRYASIRVVAAFVSGGRPFRSRNVGRGRRFVRRQPDQSRRQEDSKAEHGTRDPPEPLTHPRFPLHVY